MFKSIEYPPGRLAKYPEGLKELSTAGLRGLVGGSSGPLYSRCNTKRTNRCGSVKQATAAS